MPLNGADRVKTIDIDFAQCYFAVLYSGDEIIPTVALSCQPNIKLKWYPFLAVIAIFLMHTIIHTASGCCIFLCLFAKKSKQRAGRDTSVTATWNGSERSWKWLSSWYYKRAPFRWNFDNNMRAGMLCNRCCVVLMSQLSSYNSAFHTTSSGVSLPSQILIGRSIGEQLKMSLNFRSNRMFLITWKQLRSAFQ